jgi:hypothetical protein
MIPKPPGSSQLRPPRSRYCGAKTCEPEAGYLFEALSELKFEHSLEIDGHRLRVGVANNPWQFRQAHLLLEKLQYRNGQRSGPIALGSSCNRAVALALKIAPRSRSLRAQGILAVRCDSEDGLALDKRHREQLDRMRERGARLIEIEIVAFEDVSQLQALLQAMIRTLINPMEAWNATDIVVECPRTHAGAYCRLLGFRRASRLSEPSQKVLLRLPARNLRNQLQAHI